MQTIHERAIQKAKNFKGAESELIDIIGEVDEAKAFREKGFTSSYDYCIRFLKLSESTSYTLISIARKSREVPQLKQAIRNDLITVSSAKKIVSVLTSENKDHWLGLAQSLPKAMLEKEIARVSPQALPVEKAKYVTENRLKLELGVSEEIMNGLKRAQEVISQKSKGHASLEHVLEILLKQYLDKEDPLRKAQRSAAKEPKVNENVELVPGPVGDSKEIPFQRMRLKAQIRHQVVLRDEARCTYADPNGRRCPQRKWLQVHHRISVRAGGQNQLGNLQTLCFAHHQAAHH
jgi:hypothetical protein